MLKIAQLRVSKELLFELCHLPPDTTIRDVRIDWERWGDILFLVEGDGVPVNPVEGGHPVPEVTAWSKVTPKECGCLEVTTWLEPVE